MIVGNKKPLPTISHFTQKFRGAKLLREISRKCFAERNFCVKYSFCAQKLLREIHLIRWATKMVGNKNPLPTLHLIRWATKNRYPPYI